MEKLIGKNYWNLTQEQRKNINNGFLSGKTEWPCSLSFIHSTQISSEAHRVIQNIMDGLATANSSPNKSQEINTIRAVCRQGEMKTVKLTKVDIKLVAHNGTIYLFDLKTAKPNAGGFKEFKRTLLEWIAATLATDPTAKFKHSLQFLTILMSHNLTTAGQ